MKKIPLRLKPFENSSVCSVFSLVTNVKETRVGIFSVQRLLLPFLSLQGPEIVLPIPHSRRFQIIIIVDQQLQRAEN